MDSEFKLYFKSLVSVLVSSIFNGRFSVTLNTLNSRMGWSYLREY